MFRSALCMLLVVGMVGCGGGEQDIPLSVQNGQQGDTSTAAAAAPAPQPDPNAHVLVGNWKGGLMTTPEQLKAMGCTAVTLELEFASNGEMAMLATMHDAEGARDESSAIATWSVVKEEGNTYTIRSQESETEAQELDITMPDPNTIVVVASEGGQFKLARQ